MDPYIEEYKRLCSVLGDLTYKRKQIDKQISEVERQLEGLNLASAQSKLSKEYKEKSDL